METEKLNILKQILGKPYKSRTEYLFYCPYCNHHKKKLSINIEKNVYKCWVCDTRGLNLQRIVRRFGSYKQKQEWQRFTAEIDYSILEKFFDEPVEEKQTVELPEEFISLANKDVPPTGFPARKYLKERKIDKRDIVWWKIGYCSSGEYENRIVIPSYNDDGNADYFIARTYGRDFPKYKNPPVERDIIFNDLFIDLFQKIVKNDTPVYLALDPDAEQKSLEIIRKLLTYDVELYKIEISPYADVGEMTKEQFIDRKKKAKKMNFDEYMISKANSI